MYRDNLLGHKYFDKHGGRWAAAARLPYHNHDDCPIFNILSYYWMGQSKPI